MMPVDTVLLRDLAAKYIWWKSTEEAMRFPGRIVAQGMNIGSFEDIQRIFSVFGKEYLSELLKNAEIGQFDARSWHYWHYKLGLAELGTVPPMPVRRLG
jgi:hypothetical protein